MATTNGKKAQTKKQKSQKIELTVPTFLTQPIENGRARLKDLETQAETLLKDLYGRGKEELQGLEDLRERLALDDLKTRFEDSELGSRAKEIELRAEEIVGDVEERFQTFQARALGLAGIASRQELDRLADKLDKLSRKVDRLAKAAPKGTSTRKKTSSKRKSTARA